MRVVTVAGGNLFEIASRYLGDAAQWVRIAAANDILDPWLQGLVVLSIPDIDPSAGVAALASSSARAPAIGVTVNGRPVGGVIEAEVSSNSHLAADRFRLRLALDVSGVAVWSASDLQVGIDFGLDGAWVPMMLGQVDFVEIDPIGGEILVDGRDLAARFIEARTQETFENQTASDIATLLAGRHGLTPNVTTTSLPVGRNFQSQHARTTFDQHARITTEWDLLTRLAEQEGFAVWVDQQVLNFGAESPGEAVLVTPAECTAMRLERTLNLEGNLSVAVRSWDCRGETSMTQTASLGAGGSGANYVIVRPNVTADVAQGIAQRVLSDMAQHARCIDIEMPGELTMQPRLSLVVADTGTDLMDSTSYRMWSVVCHSCTGSRSM